jgi:hypothetical protein
MQASRSPFQKRSIPNMNSNSTVKTAEISTDPRQQAVREKEEHATDLQRANLRAGLLPAGPQHDLDDAVLFVAEFLVHLRRVLEAAGCVTTKLGSISGFDPLQQRG